MIRGRFRRLGYHNPDLSAFGIARAPIRLSGQGRRPLGRTLPYEACRPTVVAHAAASIFLIAATHPVSCNLEEFSHSRVQTERSDLTAVLLHG